MGLDQIKPLKVMLDCVIYLYYIVLLKATSYGH